MRYFEIDPRPDIIPKSIGFFININILECRCVTDLEIEDFQSFTRMESFDHSNWLAIYTASPNIRILLWRTVNRIKIGEYR